MPLPSSTAFVSEREYQADITLGLDRAFDDADRSKVQLSKLKIAVFSDLHRGARDGADDFARCERAYRAALGWYLEQGFELFLLGDVEDLWENSPDEVLRNYVPLMQLEHKFAKRTKLRRFFGNHDLDWRELPRVRDHLHPLNPKLKVREALRLKVMDGRDQLGLLFFAHGHQGTLFADRWRMLSRVGVRYVWRPLQRSQRLLSTTPAEDVQLRGKHDHAMYRWARNAQSEKKDARKRPILITGHTHHPVFPGQPPPRPSDGDKKRLKEALKNAREEDKAAIRAELELVKSVLFAPPYTPPVPMDVPCYFNAGCCCYPDGDVTCLELNGDLTSTVPLGDKEYDSRGQIRLVRWPDKQGRPRPHRLAAMSLADLFDRRAAAS